ARLTDRLDQGHVFRRLGKRFAPVRADRDEPPIIPLKAPHVEHHGPVRELDRLAPVTNRADNAAELPRPARLVAVDDMRLPHLAAVGLVITRDQEPARPQLEADARPGGVPRPFRLLDVLRDLDRLVPGRAVVSAFCRPNGPRSLAGPGNDLRLGVAAEVA